MALAVVLPATPSPTRSRTRPGSQLELELASEALQVLFNLHRVTRTVPCGRTLSCGTSSCTSTSCIVGLRTWMATNSSFCGATRTSRTSPWSKWTSVSRPRRLARQAPRAAGLRVPAGPQTHWRPQADPAAPGRAGPRAGPGGLGSPSRAGSHAAPSSIWHDEFRVFSWCACRFIGDPMTTGQAGIAMEWLHFDDNGLVRPSHRDRDRDGGSPTRSPSRSLPVDWEH